jgi:hypothetical protein
MARWLKAVIVEPEEMAIPRQHVGKHASAATNKHSSRGNIESPIFCSFCAEAV